jgi:hypothetical protein
MSPDSNYTKKSVTEAAAEDSLDLLFRSMYRSLDIHKSSDEDPTQPMQLEVVLSGLPNR